MSTTQLPDAFEVDPEDIAEPVLTRQGWITPAPDSAIALRKLYAEAGQMSPGGGGERDLLEHAERMYQRLRTRHAGNPQRLAQLAEVRAAAGLND